MGRVVEPPDVGRHVVAPGPEPREDAPHHHRGVVDVLGDDLLHLLHEQIVLQAGIILHHVAGFVFPRGNQIHVPLRGEIHIRKLETASLQAGFCHSAGKLCRTVRTAAERCTDNS